MLRSFDNTLSTFLVFTGRSFFTFFCNSTQQNLLYNVFRTALQFFTRDNIVTYVLRLERVFVSEQTVVRADTHCFTKKKITFHEKQKQRFFFLETRIRN